MDREREFPIGASITVEELTTSPYDALARLRSSEPVSWIASLDAWFVTRRDLCLEAMINADRFTVADDRFTTAQVLGTSMLSLDGPEHARHRRAFTAPFRPKFVREQLTSTIQRRADSFFAQTLLGDGELRNGVAGPLAVETILDVLGLNDVDGSAVLRWYGAFSDAIVALTVGGDIPSEVRTTLDQLYTYVGHAMASPSSSDLGVIARLVDEQILRPDEIPAAVAVVMFGAIETAEAMTANAYWHLLSHPEQWDQLRTNRSLISRSIDESLRMEPAAAWIDRYTTTDVILGDVTIPKRELVTISLLGANRDPAVFIDPDRFTIERSNLAQHVTFAQGPHACIGLHVARAETHAAITAALDWELRRGEQLTLHAAGSAGPEGLIFRKAKSVRVHGES